MNDANTTTLITSGQTIDEAVDGFKLKDGKSGTKDVSNESSHLLSNGLNECRMNGNSDVTAKTSSDNFYHNNYDEGSNESTNGDDRVSIQYQGHADLNDVIQNQLQPLLENVSLNGANMNELQQQLAARFGKQQNSSGSAGLIGGNGGATILVGNSNGSSSSTSPPLKTSESSLSPAAQSTSQQISSASSSSIISSGSHSNNWNGQQQQQPSQSSISPNDTTATGTTSQANLLLENMSSAAVGWTSALNGSQQQISPSQVGNGLSEGSQSGNSQQQKQQSVNPAALASLLKANNLASGQTSSNLLNNLNSIYSPNSMLKAGNQSATAAAAALAALADANGKMNGSQQRSLLTNNSNGIQPGRNGYIGEDGDNQQNGSGQNGQIDLSLFNNHQLVELIKNDPTQLEQILKLRSMYQSEDVAGVNANGNTFMEELVHQLDQTVPANLAAAVAAAAAANSGLGLGLNQANSNRNSPRSVFNMPKFQQHLNANGHHQNQNQYHHHQQQQQQHGNFNHHHQNHNNHHQSSHQHFNGHQNHHYHNHHNHNNMMNAVGSMNGNTSGHMMMNSGYNGMSQKHQSYQHHHYQQQQQQQQLGYHPNQYGMNQPSQTYHQNFLNMTLQQQQQFGQFQDQDERFSRKVFVGGLPPDIDEDEIVTHFRRYGNLVVDWPHKAESKSYFPPKGYAFLIFQEERNVQDLIETCVMDDGKLYMVVSSPSMKDKPVQIRPWCLADSDFVMDGSQPLDPRKTIFVGGVPRPLKAIELAMIMDRLYGGVCYAGIDTDPELKYPKGAGRVAFSNQQSYIAAISARFVQLHHGEIDKRVEVKPYVLDDQMCDECQGVRCGGKFAPFFCANVTCLQYYCEQCWTTIHSRPGREYHKPLVKEGADRPRPLPYLKSKNRENYE